MQTFSSLGFIDLERLSTLKHWCLEQAELMPLSPSTYVVGVRHQKWFEKGWTLGKKTKIFDAPSDRSIFQIGQKLFPSNDSCLFLHYRRGAYIKSHRDHTVSQNKVVQINLGCTVIFRVNNTDYTVRDGEIICFDSKLPHSVSPASSDRFVLSWRKIKPQYLSTQLSLF